MTAPTIGLSLECVCPRCCEVHHVAVEDMNVVEPLGMVYGPDRTALYIAACHACRALPSEELAALATRPLFSLFVKMLLLSGHGTTVAQAVSVGAAMVRTGVTR